MMAKCEVARAAIHPISRLFGLPRNDTLLYSRGAGKAAPPFSKRTCFECPNLRASLPENTALSFKSRSNKRNEGLQPLPHHHLLKKSQTVSLHLPVVKASGSMVEPEKGGGNGEKSGAAHVLTVSPSVTGPASGRLAEKLEDAGFIVHKLWEQKDPDSFFASQGNMVKALVPSHEGVDGKLMDSLPNLEIIANFGVGYDAIDVKAAKERGVRVTNTPDVLTDDVADLALALMLDASRRLTLGDKYLREGKWEKGNFPVQRKVSGKNVGILGLGRIGEAIASRASAFKMKVAYHSRHEKPGVPYEYHSKLVDLAKASDFLVVACPGGPSTEHLVTREVLDALGPEGCLVNIARGSVVVESELVKALTEGRLGSAGLDVFENEPHVPEELRKMENVVLQPHVGSATYETREDMADLVVANLTAHFGGKELPTPVA